MSNAQAKLAWVEWMLSVLEVEDYYPVCLAGEFKPVQNFDAATHKGTQVAWLNMVVL